MSNIVNFSTTESVEDIQAAGKHYGIQFDIETIGTGIATEEEAAAAAAPAEEKPAEETESSKPNEGDAEAEVKPVEAEEEAESKSELETDERADEKPHKKLLRQVDKMTGRARTAENELKAERAKVVELERKLAEGKKEPEAPAPVVQDDTPKRPQRPSRPKLDQFEYDQERFEAAQDVYETTTIPAYEDALGEYTRKETIRELTAQQEAARQKQAEEAAESEWQEAISARDGLKDKLAEATDVKISSAMDVTLKSIFKPADRALILEHFVDNPDEAEAMMGETISEKEKPTRGDWEYLTNRATMLLTELKVKLKAGKPAPAKAPEKPVTPVPPAKPKPPVSAAPAPIDPVGGNNNSTATDLESANTEAYLAQRAAQRIEKNKRQFAR